MFTTCLHCHSALGRNEVIEHFPVGRRLAFDAAKGRLWVVCAKCRRWNLTPLEERWEAIEECERLYSGTRLRASTDNIGLARLADGLDVVRIGKPKTPEMAAWRYARDFRRRWIQNGVPLAFLAGGGLPGIQYGLGVDQRPETMGVFLVFCAGLILSRFTKPRVPIALPSGKVTRLSPLAYRHARLYATPDGWGVDVGHPAERSIITGPIAVPALRGIITARNFAGAPTREISAAIAHLDEARRSDQFIQRLARASAITGIQSYPPDIALALEMALHEDTERRALEGELHLLRDEWELAEEVAHIADNLLLPAVVQERFGAITNMRHQ